MSGFGPPPGAPAEDPRRRRPSYLPPSRGLARHAGMPGEPAAHRPGIIPLRPLTLSDILDGAVKSFRRNPGATAGLSLLVNAVAILPAVLVVGLVATGTWFASSGAGAVIDGATFVVLLLAGGSAFATMLLSGMLSYAVAEAALGRRPAAGEVWRAVHRRLPGLLGLQVAVGTALAAPLLGFLGALALVADAPVPLVLAYGLALGVAVGALVAWLATKTVLAAPVLVLERRGAVGALRRAWTLSAGSFWRLLGVGIVAAGLALVVFSVVQLPVLGIGLLVLALLEPGPGAFVFLTSLVVNVATMLAAALVTPFLAAVVCLQYLDTRMRREGFALVLVRAAAAASERGGR